MPEFRPVIDLSNLNPDNSFKIIVPAGADYSPSVMTMAGDINGDGFNDLILGALDADAGGENSGSTFVVFGTASGFPSEIKLGALDGSNGFRIDGEMAYDLSGGSVSSAGDVNGDGIDDLIIGAAAADPHGDTSGAAYVVFGTITGIPGSLSLSDLDGSNGFKISGSAFHDRFGGSVSSAGDVNGDGFDDIIVGAFTTDGVDIHDYNTGSSYIVFGKASGFAANIDVTDLNGSNGFRIIGADAYDYSGARVAGAGDVNGDGFDDLLITAVPYGGRSATYVVFGKASGFGAVFDLSALDGSNGFKFASNGGKYNSDVVASAGDVNGDGFDDIIVGAAFSGTNYSGNANVVFGRAGGFADTLNAFELNGSNGFRISGGTDYSYTGYTVAGAGDVNGDGFDDVLVSAAGAYPSPETFSFVVFGKASGFDATLLLSDIDGSNGFKIEDSALLRVTAIAGGDINHDGFDDLIATGLNGTSHIIYGHRALDAVTRIVPPSTTPSIVGGVPMLFADWLAMIP